MYPFTFKPILKERVWGGRNLARLYGKELPSDNPMGESWEVTDRPEGVSLITNGPFAGHDLRWLMENHARELLGDAVPENGRFPLLVKILDAQDKLSLQVHPPAEKAAALRGEPKTEMWYVADATPEADIFVGLRKGATRAEFESRMKDGSLAECFHRIPVKTGDTMFLPSGRAHALGAGSVIFEIQQNSDTTYRVFDWNRVGIDGKPRELHLEQALESIDFADFEPGLARPKVTQADGCTESVLVDDALFVVLLLDLEPGNAAALEPGECSVLGLISGELAVRWPEGEVTLQPGGFCLIPACLGGVSLAAKGSAARVIRAVPR